MNVFLCFSKIDIGEVLIAVLVLVLIRKIKRKDASNGMGSPLVSRKEEKRPVSSFLSLFFLFIYSCAFFEGDKVLSPLILKAYFQA